LWHCRDGLSFYRGQFIARTQKERERKFRPRSIICELPALWSEDLLCLSDLLAVVLFAQLILLVSLLTAFPIEGAALKLPQALRRRA